MLTKCCGSLPPFHIPNWSVPAARKVDENSCHLSPSLAIAFSGQADRKCLIQCHSPNPVTIPVYPVTKFGRTLNGHHSPRGTHGICWVLCWGYSTASGLPLYSPASLSLQYWSRGHTPAGFLHVNSMKVSIKEPMLKGTFVAESRWSGNNSAEA